jgi:2-dehydro-3-deoxy-D-arabinonate dehydratase
VEILADGPTERCLTGFSVGRYNRKDDMRLYRTTKGAFVEHESRFYFLYAGASADAWDMLVSDPGLPALAQEAIRTGAATKLDPATALPPIGSQEVWAAGVTYYRSRTARMEESKGAGGGNFYDRVYAAERPELFFKATGRRVVGPGQPVRIRSDAKWSVPEPELTLVINPAGTIIGCTIGNDMSSRDIEGENPLYLPQAKLFAGSCALGPAVLVADGVPAAFEIRLRIAGPDGEELFAGETSTARMKRSFEDLVAWLRRDNPVPSGSVLLTGTGLVPPDDFTLRVGQRVEIHVPGIGTLVNPVGRAADLMTEER